MYNTVLFIGTGQIGKAVLKEILEKKPKKIIIHNLTKDRTDNVIKEMKNIDNNIEYFASFGNIFMPIHLNKLDFKNMEKHFEEIKNYFYSPITIETYEKSTIVDVVKKYRPDLIIDAVNTATVLGNNYNPEYTKKLYENDTKKCSEMLMANDYTTKIINFVYSLKYAMEKYEVKKYVKVSTTGLGGMGLTMPYTHGDNPKIQLSSALMGKIGASGVLHQLLWNLSHVKGIDVSLIIPGAFVGYDSIISEQIETDQGFLKKSNYNDSYKIEYGKMLKYNKGLQQEDLVFPVIRAGENHVYSELELKTLTAIGQMEAITKEEVANKVIDSIYGKSTNDIISSLDKTMLSPTYKGREMIIEAEEEFKKINYKHGIATGNLGVSTSKRLYELFLIKKLYPTIDSLKSVNDNTLTIKINESLDKEIIEEINSLGIPILTNEEEIYISDYSLVPDKYESKMITKESINNWANIGWVDLRKNNLSFLKNKLILVYEDAKIRKKSCNRMIDKEFRLINNDYSIAEYLAYHYNMNKKGRKK